MRRISLFFFLVSGFTLLFATGSRESDADMKTNITIGISKIIAHPALDAVEKGIKDELSTRGWNIQYDDQNANGDLNAAATIAQKFKADKVSLAIGIATPTAQALVQTLKTIPVVYTAVTDPVAAGIVRSYDKGCEYVTGVSDRTPVKEQIELLLKINPAIKTIGHVYTSSEENAVVVAGLVKEVVRKLNLNYVETTVNNSAEVRSAMLSIAKRIDALYVSTDNTVVSALPALVDVARKYQVAIMSADPSSSMETGGILVAWGFDYYKMGRFTGKLVYSILNKEKKIVDIPTQYMTNPNDVQIFIDLDVAKALKLQIPENILSKASKVRENGSIR